MSYDQVQNSFHNNRSLAYWTIVGAYFVRGDRNETHTLLDVGAFVGKTHSQINGLGWWRGRNS